MGGGKEKGKFIVMYNAGKKKSPGFPPPPPNVRE